MSVQNSALLAAAFNTVTEDPELSSADRLVLLAIVSHCKTQDQSVYPSIEGRLDSMTGLSARTIRYALYGREAKGGRLPGLIERGYLSVADRGFDRSHSFALGHRLLGIAEPADPTVGLDPATIAGTLQPLQAEGDKPATIAGYPATIADEDRESVRTSKNKPNTTDRNTSPATIAGSSHNGYKAKRPGESRTAYATRVHKEAAAV